MFVSFRRVFASCPLEKRKTPPPTCAWSASVREFWPGESEMNVEMSL